MIYRRAFIGEALAHLALVLCLLSVVVLLIVTTRVLSDIAEIRLGLGDVALLVLLGMLRYAPLLISFSVVAGLLAAFDRMNSDRELLFWEVAGLRRTDWIGSVLQIVVPFALLCAAMAVEGSPWAARTSAEIRRQVIDRAEIVGREGVFGEIGRLGIVYHIAPGRAVLIQQGKGRNNIVLASGGIENEGDTPVLLLGQGRAYSARRHSEEIYDVEFEGGSIAVATPESVLSLKLKSMSVRDLDLGDRRHQAELCWRIGLPLSLLALALMVPFATGRQVRRPRAASILVAVAGYWFFYSTMSLMKELAVRGETIPPALLVFAPVAVAVLLTLLLAAVGAGRRRM